MSFADSDDKKVLFFPVLFFTVFCSFNFIPVISAEIQPVIGAVLLFVGVCKVITTMKCDLYVLSIIFFMLAMLLPLLFGITKSASAIMQYVLYLIGPVILCYFIKYAYLIKTKHLKFFIIIFFIVTIIQVFSPVSIQSMVNPLLGSIIKRAQLGSYGEMRGVGLLYSEPAHAAKYIYTLFVLCFVLRYCKVSFNQSDQLVTKNKFLFFLLALIFISYFNKSASLYFLCLLNIIAFLLLYALNINAKKILVAIFVVPLSFLFLLFLLSNYEFSGASRIGSMIDSYYHVKDDFTLSDLQYFGSIRSISVISGYSGIYFHPFGVGIGQGEKEIFEVMETIGFDIAAISFLTTQEITSLKPNAYGAQIWFEAGIFGALIISSFVFFVIKQLAIKTTEKCIFSAIVLTSLFQILFFSTTTLPEPWLLLGVGLCGLKRCRVS